MHGDTLRKKTLIKKFAIRVNKPGGWGVKNQMIVLKIFVLKIKEWYTDLR